jgi:hypothetical protein
MQQMTLIDAPPLMPTLPPVGLSVRCLRMLLSGCSLDCESFHRSTGSMRLAAYVEVLHRLGWPILTAYENRGASRNPAVYSLDLEGLAEVMTLLNAHLGKEAETVQ